jgi:hypothetical protein
MGLALALSSPAGAASTAGALVASGEAEAPAALEEDDSPKQAPRPVPSGRRSLGFLGWSGVAAMVLGAGALAAGIGVVAYQSRPARCDAGGAGATADCEPAEVTTRPEGWILLGAGAALVTAGLVRVLIDRPKRRRAVAAPTVGPRAAGLTLGVSF